MGGHTVESERSVQIPSNAYQFIGLLPGESGAIVDITARKGRYAEGCLDMIENSRSQGQV